MKTKSKKSNWKKGDTALILSGRDKGKKGKVTAVLPSEGKIVVEKVNILTRHMKPRRQGDAGGIVKSEGAFDWSKAIHLCAKCGERARLGHRELADGTKVRYCKKCGDEM